MLLLLSKATFVLCAMIHQAVASCPVSVGDLNVTDISPIPKKGARYLFIPDLKLPCKTKIYGWNVMANFAGKIEFAVLRIEPHNALPTLIKPSRFVDRKVFTASRGLNIFTDKTTEFAKGDTIAFIAIENQVSGRPGKSTITRYEMHYSNDEEHFHRLRSSDEKPDLLAILQESLSREFVSSENVYSGAITTTTRFHFHNLTLPPLIQEAFLSGANLQKRSYTLCSDTKPCAAPKKRSLLALEIRRHFGNRYHREFKIDIEHWRNTSVSTEKLLVRYPVVWDVWNNWSTWNSCTLSLSSTTHGYQFRERTCSIQGSCRGVFNESRICNLTCSAGLNGGTVNCPVGSIIVNSNSTKSLSPNHRIKWKVARPRGEIMQFSLDVKNFSSELTTCVRKTSDRLEIRDLSGLWMGVICNDNSKFFSCSNGVDITFVYGNLHNRSSYPGFNLSYVSMLESENKHTSEYCLPCGGNLTNPSGKILPRRSITRRFLPYENCVWRIRRNATEGIHIRFTQFLFTDKDFIHIIDGDTNQNVVSLTNVPGVRLPDDLFLDFHNVVIRFQTGGEWQRLGFKLHYSAYPLFQSSSSIVTTLITSPSAISTAISSSTSAITTPTTTRAATSSAFSLTSAITMQSSTQAATSKAISAATVTPSTTLAATSAAISHTGAITTQSSTLAATSKAIPTTASNISTPTTSDPDYETTSWPTSASPSTETIKPTATPNHICSTHFWMEWSQWSICSGQSRDALKGIRRRTRTCQSFQVNFNQTNCSLVPTPTQDHFFHGKTYTTGGTGNGAPCVFPFFYKGRNYTQCTDALYHVFWCGTTYNYTKDEKWGICVSAGYGNSTTSGIKCGDSLDTLIKTRPLPASCYFPAECTGGMKEADKEDCRLATKCIFNMWTSWQPWSSCGTTSMQSRKRSCNKIVFAAKGSSKCILVLHSHSYCPRDSIFPSHYYFKNSTDSPKICDSKCADDSNRTCKAFLYSNTSCTGIDSELKPCGSICNVSNCDGGWANWGECFQTCGKSSRTRYAYCKTDVACDDVIMETETCPYVPCAVDGQWTGWSPWSNCSKPCFGGLQKRTRSCTNPLPRNGGLNCSGIHEEMMGCNFFRCPVNGGFSPWSSWSYCDQPCGGGKISRFRQCNSPSPDFGGRDCGGVSTEVIGCNNHTCQPVKFDVLLKFTNETFSTAMLSRNSTAFIDFSLKVKDNLLQLYKGRDQTIQDVVINNLSKGSVKCNFSIVFNQSSTDELLIFQHATEDVGSMAGMPVRPLSISSQNVPAGPTSVTATSTTSTTITVKWSGFSTSNSITGIVIFYREFGTNSWKKSPAGCNDTQNDLLMLKEFTLYTVRVYAFTRNGMGAGSSYVDCSTKEGVPSSPPSNPKCTSVSSTKLLIAWSHINTSNWNGQYKGYMIRYREFTPTATWLNTTNRKTDSFFTIENLKPFTRYEVEIAGVTGAGVGRFSWLECATDEGAPSSSPDDVIAKLVSRDGKIVVDWNPLPESKQNGILQGYTVYFTVIRIGTEEVVEGVKSVTASKYSARVILTGFKAYTQVKIEVAAFTIAGEGPKSPSSFVETCQCPKNIFVGWYSFEPYVYGDSTKPVGILSDLVTDTISKICKFCNGNSQHNLGDVRVFFNRTKNGKLGKFQNEKELKRKIDTNAHLFLPMYGREEIDIYQDNFQFALVANNPGSILLVKKVLPESITKSITELVLKIWPVLLVVVLMGSICGTLLWMADRQINPNELNVGSYIRGTLSGVWWSFVTMTTVGYGDITPRSFFGKLIGIFWMLVGPILNSLIVGSLTSAITAVVTSKPTMLYGMTVAAVYQSFEYNLAVRRNARVSQTVLYNNNSDVLKALENGAVKGALLDSLSVASMMNSPKLDNMGIRMGKFIKAPHGFGIVLSPEIISLKAEIQTYINSKRREIKERIENYSKALEANDASGGYVGVNMLATITSYGKTFKECAIGLSTAIVVFSIACLIVRLLYRYYKKKRVAPVHLSGIARLKNLEKEVCRTADEITSQVESKLKEICNKHEQECEKWFATQKYNFGVLGVPKFGTMDKQKIKRKITLNDIMASDLKLHSRRDLRGKR